MKFSIRQLLAAIFVIGPATGLALNYGSVGVFLAILYAAISAFLIYLANRTAKTWCTVGFFRRTYGIFLSTLCLTLWLLIIVNIALNPSIYRRRVLTNLQRSLNQDERFQSVRVEYVEAKLQYIAVSGTLNNENDLEALREIILDRNWMKIDGVSYEVKILSTKRKIDEWYRHPESSSYYSSHVRN